MNRYSKFFFLVLVITAGSTVAYAATHGMENDAAAVTKAKIPLTQAVTVAEQNVSGKAARAEYENSRNGWVYDVEVVNGARVFDVKVDADEGTIISSVEDKADRDDKHDEKD